MRKYKVIMALVMLTFLCARPAWAWFYEGHKVIAVIAADNLTTAARSHVAKILSVPNNRDAVETAMAAASLRPDTEFRTDPKTPPWHYIGLCLQDSEQDLPARCPHGNCVTAKINEYAHRLRTHDYDKWGAAGDLAFLIHFVGDIHQPLHAAGNADRGGTCQKVNVEPPEDNLHYAWDDAVVVSLERQLGTHEAGGTARKLEKLYSAKRDAIVWRPGTSAQIAWETHQLAESEVYRALGIPERPCELDSCDTATNTPVTMSREYMERAGQVAGRQMAKAGNRLAALLNQLWLPRTTAP